MPHQRRGSLRKKGRQNPWATGSHFLSFLRSAPTSPVLDPSEPKQRSMSVGGAEIPALSLPPNRINVGSLFHRARRPSNKRAVTDSELAWQQSSPESQSMPSSRSGSFSIPNTARQHSLFAEAGDADVDRLQLKNYLVKLAFADEFLLPLDLDHVRAGRVLDIGCGPGTWCIEMAEKHPTVQVIGVDTGNMFPDPDTIPSNCLLLVNDVLNGLTEFSDLTFDLVQIRFMALTFNLEQYAQVVRDCWRLLKPGGYLEILEMDFVICSAGPTTSQLNNEVIQAAQAMGFDSTLVQHLTQLVPEQGIVQERYRSLPIGVWGGRLGVLCRDDLCNLLHKCQSAVRNHFQRTDVEKEDQLFKAHVSAACREVEQYQSYSNFRFLTVQKPSHVLL